MTSSMRAQFSAPALGHRGPPPHTDDEPAGAQVVDRSIGDFLRQLRGLDDSHIEEILALQRTRGIRFGEAAVALRYATQDDVLWALSQQFHYPYYPGIEGTPFHAELVAANDPFCDQSEVFRELRSSLMMGVLSPEHPPAALAVLSPDVGDGKSFFAANMAVTFSHLGGRTLLVDADMRTPRQHELFGVPNHVGLSSLLSGRAEADAIHQVPNLPSLYVLPVGTVPPNPLELVQRNAFSVLVRELLSKFDHVVMDTPAAVHGADSRVVALKCGSALVIGRRGQSRIKSMQRLLSSLAKSPVRMAGVMVNEH